MSRAKKGTGGYILLAAAFILLFAVLKLGKHTWLGWILGIFAAAGFVYLKKKVLAGRGAGIRLLGWAGFFCVWALIFWISWPPAARR